MFKKLKQTYRELTQQEKLNQFQNKSAFNCVNFVDMSKPLPGALADTKIRTRKRNIVVQKDPESFLEALEHLFVGNSLEDVFKNLDSATDIDYKTYHEFFFDRFISGSIGVCFGRVDKRKTPRSPSIFADSLSKVDEWISVLERFMRKRPYMRVGIGEVIGRAMLTIDNIPQYLDHIMSICSHLANIDILKYEKTTEFFLLKLLRITHLVVSGEALNILSKFANSYAALSSQQKAWEYLLAGEVVDKIFDFCPEHCSDVLKLLEDSYGMKWFVDLYRTNQTKNNITIWEQKIIQYMQKEPEGEEETIETLRDDALKQVTQCREECSMSIEESIMLMWRCIVSLSKTMSKDIVAALRKWGPCLSALVGDDMVMQAKLLSTVQITCYNNPNIINSFKPIVVQLYDLEILEADVIIAWANGNSGPGRSVFGEQLAEFVAWLEADDGEDC